MFSATAAVLRPIGVGVGAEFGLLGVVGATVAASLMLLKLAIGVARDAVQLLNEWRLRVR